jgi:hypothetical protein
MSLIIFKTVDSATMQSIGNVALSATANASPGWQAESNACGDAITEFIQPGHYSITFRKAGYKDRVLPADLAASGIITVGLDRTSGPVPPDPTPVPVPPTPGGPMPNRKDEVKMICDLHPEAFPEGDDDALNAARLKLLKTVIIPTLNALDGGQWGLLMKTDQGNKIPVDIACWRPGNQYADVMTGKGANWQEWTNPNPSKWVWVAA